jgi:hypothetical protein
MTLVDAMRREFSAAKLAWALVTLAQLVGMAVAVIGFFDALGPVAAAGAGLAVPVVTAVARAHGTMRHSRGEELRRALVRSDGWGKQVDSHALLLCVADGSRVASWDSPPIGSYFSSPYRPGPRRAAHIVEQSAFFTVRHAATLTVICGTVVVAGFGMGVALLWLLAHGLFAVDLKPAIAQAAGALLAFSASSEFLGVGIAFARLRSTARRTLEECSTLARQARPDKEQVAFVIGSYDVGLAQSPPIPGILYRVERRRLEEAWQEHEAGTVAATAE